MRQFYHYVITRIFCTASILMLTACSIFGNSSGITIPISTRQLSTMPDWKVESIDSELDLYRVISSTPDIVDSGSYMTALSQCGLGRTASAIATTRQLLVGLKEIKLERNDSVLLEGTKVFFTLFNAKLDQHDLNVACFSVRNENCVQDLILWNDIKSRNSMVQLLGQASLEELHSFIKNFQTVLVR